MDTKLALDKKTTVKLNYEAVLADLAQVEPILSIFPKIDKLEALGANSYMNKLKPIGAMGVEHAVSYAAVYTVDASKGQLRFKGIEGKGNATLSGEFDFVKKGDQVEVEIRIEGQLRDIKVPMLMRPATPGFIKSMFEGLVDRFIEKIAQKYPG